MVFEHNTLKPFDRYPQGALPAGAQVRLRLSAVGKEELQRVELRVWDGEEHRFPMRPLGMRGGKQYYEAQIAVSSTPCLYWYRFEAMLDGRRLVLGAPEDHTGCGEGKMGSEESFQITVYDPDYRTPDWMHEGVMYQIMVDRFFRGEGTEALLHAKDGQNIMLHEAWDEMPFLNISENGDNFANDFYGGNLEGVRQKLSYLRDLGVTVLYFNPIFEARTNHKYDTSDYMRVDPMFGDEKTLRALCAEAKKLGIRVMLDGVFSHVGDDSVYFNRRGTHGEKVGAYRDPDSPYAKWFTFRRWPDDYDCWWGFRTLPNVREMDEDYRRYILNGEDAVVKHWPRQGTSGWRLDVADELPMEFLRELRREVKSVSEDCAVLGEVWEDASHKVSYGQIRSYVLGDTLDSVMNYPLREALIDFLMGRRTAGGVARELASLNQNYPKPFLYALMNLMGSHDRPRILNVLAGNDGSDIPRAQRARHSLTQEERMVGTLREHMMLRVLMSVPGMPCVYYADEAALEGCADPFCRRTYPWGHEDGQMLAYYRRLIAMRKAHQELRTGECAYIAPDDDVFGVIRTISGGVDALGKPAQDACAVTLINRSARAVDVYLTQEDVLGARELTAENGETLHARAGAFSLRIMGLRGMTYFTRPAGAKI
ncbi:MAG: glycoside hydrolase family 13 protein [Clostridiales bacterium]|nr:glycoside hydrolase family 13 protein [Clostridiales bacterium]